MADDDFEEGVDDDMISMDDFGDDEE